MTSEARSWKVTWFPSALLLVGMLCPGTCKPAVRMPQSAWERPCRETPWKGPQLTATMNYNTCAQALGWFHPVAFKSSNWIPDTLEQKPFSLYLDRILDTQNLVINRLFYATKFWGNLLHSHRNCNEEKRSTGEYVAGRDQRSSESTAGSEESVFCQGASRASANGQQQGDSLV